MTDVKQPLSVRAAVDRKALLSVVVFTHRPRITAGVVAPVVAFIAPAPSSFGIVRSMGHTARSICRLIQSDSH